MTPGQFAARLQALGPGGLIATLRPVVRDALVDMEGRAKDNVTARLSMRSGHLRRSIATSSEATSDDVILTLRAGGATRGGRQVVYARMQEQGGIVRPKNARYLRIPLPAALTRAGSDRFATPLRITGAGLFHVERHGGKLFLFRSDKRGAAARQPWYVLTKGPVVVPARYFLRDARDSVASELPARIQAAVVAAMVGGAP